MAGVEESAMEVGVNYPWFDYGWDFGRPPDGWRSGQDPRWVMQIDHDLELFGRIGISVVRWFILGDGLTYGTSADAPQFDPATDQWQFDPPDLSKEFLADFETLLQKLSSVNSKASRPVLLLPVFVDYKFCERGLFAVAGSSPETEITPATQWVKSGRAQAISDPTKRLRFLQRALQPLLELAAESYRNAIYAWDIINEPEWVTNNWNPDAQKTNPVHELAMTGFIEDSKSMIRSFGFKPTIGFNAIETIRKSGVSAEVNQFHFYSDPDPERQRKLEKSPFSSEYPGIIGEFATSSSQDYWPDLEPHPQSVLNRLRFARNQNYGLALPWSFHDKAHPDSHSGWCSQVEQEIECFVFGRNCAGNDARKTNGTT
jgi:hypothetical protein